MGKGTCVGVESGGSAPPASARPLAAKGGRRQGKNFDDLVPELKAKFVAGNGDPVVDKAMQNSFGSKKQTLSAVEKVAAKSEQQEVRRRRGSVRNKNGHKGVDGESVLRVQGEVNASKFQFGVNGQSKGEK